MVRQPSRVLVIATHPDDEVLGCGGVMARHADRGDAVHVLVVTRGVPEIFPPEEVEGIREELRRAHDLLRVATTRFLDFPAPKMDMVPQCELAQAISGVVRELQPHTVYIPHHGDLHIDHRAVYLASLVATRPVNACSVRRLLCYETLSETDWAPPRPDQAFVPTVFVDISDYLTRKLEALACYQSQLRQPPNPRSLQTVGALAQLRGATVGVEAAEAFMLVREVAI